MKPIKGFPNYFITPNGEVYSNYKKGYLKPRKQKNGYVIVTLRKDELNFNKFIHRLVAQSYIANPENKPQVNHINLIKTDNRIENLEWNTNKENMIHFYKNSST